jgi:alcohol dehydrogenase (cytochrome c)
VLCVKVSEAGTLLLLASTVCAAQVSKDPKQIELGRAIFRVWCAPCHGIRGEGGRGPDLTRGTYNNGDQDADLFRVISRGVPGTEMPAGAPDLDPASIWRVISFIRSTVKAQPGLAPGNQVAGEKLFWGKGGCGQCHVVEGRGGSLGPDLTRVGRQRSLAYLRESVLSPSADLSPGFETVEVVTRDGRKLVGVAKRLDNFSVELIDPAEKLHSLPRSALLSVNRESRSLMPDSYGRLFAEPELKDLLAFLSSLRGSAAGPPAPSAVTGWLNEKRLLMSQDDPSTWLMYGRNYAGWRYSPLKQINAGNVARLRTQWIFQTSNAGKMETTPLIYDGTMWLTGPSNHAYALDLRSGREIWHYHTNVPEGMHLCCGEPNRGFAALGGLSFKVNLEGDLLALDSKSGQLVWKTQLADYHKAYSATGAPLVVKNLVLVGIAGGDFGGRGFIDAYEAQTGRRVWRFYTVPAPGEPGSETWRGDSWKHGAGHPWTTGTYDPDLNLVYWGTGNPGPDQNGDVRPGDNLYTCSLVALDADSGKLKWYYQFTPHDTHDWDAIGDPVLVDLVYQGRPVKAVMQADRNGFFYVLDRTYGRLLVAKPYTKVSWATGIGTDGRPILVPGQDPSEDGQKACPAMGGGHNWEPTAYSPQTGLYYFPSANGCQVFYKMLQEFVEGDWYQASAAVPVRGEVPGTGSILAVDPATGEIKWRFELVSGPTAGLLATGGGLVFTGDSEGYLFALDARTGEVLWHFQAGGMIATAPVTYSVDGRQVVAVASGGNVLTFTLPEEER